MLRTPADRALARRWALSGGTAGRGLAARLREAGTVERRTYVDEEHDEGSFDLSAKLGIAVGLEREAGLIVQRLVDARLLNRPFGGRRLDCTGA